MASSHLVIKVLNENTIQVDPRWDYFHTQGKYIEIFGLLPVEKSFRDEEVHRLENLIKHKTIQIQNACYISGGELVAIVFLDKKPLIDYFIETKATKPIRVLSPKSFNRWQYPEDYKKMTKISGGFPEGWENPIAKLPLDKDPFFRSIAYPTKKWESNYSKQKTIADSLFSLKQFSGDELKRNLEKLNDPERDGDILFIGEIGIGKTWFISHFLMNLPENEYDSIMIDMKHVVVGKDLIQSINDEIELYFDSYLLKNLIWCHSYFRNMYGLFFDPDKIEQRNEMVKYSLSLTTQQRNIKRLNYYGTINNKKLVICFDNIDQLSGYDQEQMVDFCRRITGGKSNVRVIYVLRPDTMIPKSRKTSVWGDSQLKIVDFKGSDIYDILQLRLTHDKEGNSWPLETLIPGSRTSYKDIMETYMRSDNSYGLARFIRGISSTARIQNGMILWGKKENHEEMINKIDVRHYIQMFRRVLRSDFLKDFSNIGNLYYGIQALMIRNFGFMEESESYLFNLFDNEESSTQGNALIRYRVLEYFYNFRLADNTFDSFFDVLGYDSANARGVLKKFIDADLVDVFIDNDTGQTLGMLTIPGRKHFEIVQNLWYIICIKTGMNIYEEYVLFKDKAKNEMKKYNFTSSLVEYYSVHGWVSEMDFVNFIADQVAIEGFRFGENLGKILDPTEVRKWSQMYHSFSKIHENLSDSIDKQLSKWETKGESR